MQKYENKIRYLIFLVEKKPFHSFHILNKKQIHLSKVFLFYQLLHPMTKFQHQSTVFKVVQ
jgi:hypothetical protein